MTINFGLRESFKIMILLSLLFALTIQLRMKEDHQSIQTNEHQSELTHNFNHEQRHFEASSMSINYTEEILKVSNKFAPAADINNRFSKVQNTFMSHEQEVQILTNFTFSPLETDQVTCQNISVDTMQALLFRTSEIRTYLENALTTNEVNFITKVDDRPKAKQSIENEITYLKGIETFLSSGCTKKVQILGTYFVSNPNANNWILGDWTYDNFIKSIISVFNSSTKVNKCPIQKPFYDPTSDDCINCVYPNNIWNMQEKKCVSCPYAHIVNVKTRKCVSEIRYANNIMDENYQWITEEKILQVVYDKFMKEKAMDNVVVCPFDTPFIIREKCSTCPQNWIYSLEQSICLPIPYNMQYDPNLHKVVELLPSYQTNDAISSNVVEDLKSCPIQFPYYDNITCINCVFPNYFNEKRKKCVPCVNLDMCGAKKLSYVTNSLGKNITGKSTQEVKSYFASNAQKIKDDSVEECPISTPYYNPSQRQCIQCPPQKYLFNISSLSCVSCPFKSYFNQSSYFCELPKGVKTYSKAVNLIVENITKYTEEQNKITGQECSENLPYFNGKQCISCPTGQLFNVTSLACVYCPVDKTYDNVLMKCDTIKYKTNSLTDRLWIANIATYQNAYKINPGKECPSTEPFFNETACINCRNDQIFNTSSLKCTQCPNGTIFNNINKNCAENKSDIFVPGKIDNLIGVPSYSVETYLRELKNPNETLFTVKKCQDDQNSKMTGCVKCNSNFSYFSVKTLECVACKQFDKQLKICYDNMTYLTNTTSSGLMVGLNPEDVDNYIKTQDIKFKETPDLYLRCSAQKSYSIKGICQSCDKYFNVTSQNCTTCDFYDVTTKTCGVRAYISNLRFGVPPYYSKNTTSLLEQYGKAVKNGAQICPFPNPFFNGKQCILCPQTDQYFNLDLKKCQNCTSGHQLNTIINECQQQPPKFYTALESPNLVFDGQPLSYYQYKLDQAKKAGSGPCPQDKPYYTKNNQCENCSNPNQYFNLLRRICTSCAEGSNYVSEDHECETPIGDIVTPQATLEKSLANFFT